MSLNLFKKPLTIQAGIDITAEGFSIVCLSLENSKYVLKNLYIQKFQEESLQDGMIAKSDTFAENLKKIVEENNFEIKTINISVSSSNVFVKTITFPDLPIEELKVIIPQEAAKHLPLSVNEINSDFQVIESSKKENKQDIILCALSKSIARNLVDTISKAGIETTAIDVSSFATIRTLANIESINDPESSYISVLIGYEDTDINIIKNGIPVFSHNTQTGKKHIVETLMKGLEISREEALLKLPQLGLILPGMEASSDPEVNKAANILRNHYSNISAEIQKAIEFYTSQDSENNEIENSGIEKIILSGCGVCVQNIDKYISAKLRIPTELCDSFKNISHSLELTENILSPVNIPALSTCIGLALKETQN